MEPTKIATYFVTLKKLMDKNNFHIHPNRIWNIDETGIQLEHKPSKVLARKGSKYLHSTTSGNKETITVVVAAVSTAGKSIYRTLLLKKRLFNPYGVFKLIRHRKIVRGV